MPDYVLVVDDDPDVRTLVIDTLKLFGLKGLSAFNGEVALQIIADDPPRAIVLDLMMPGMNGFATITALHRDQSKRDIPIILMSGISDSITLARLPGVVGVIRKGEFSVERFRSMLDRAGIAA